MLNLKNEIIVKIVVDQFVKTKRKMQFKKGDKYRR